MPGGDGRPVQPSESLSVEVAKRATGPDLLVRGDCQPGNPARTGPLREKRSVGVEDLDPLIVPVGDIDAALAIDDAVVRKPELAGPGASLAPLEQVLAVARVLHDPGAAVAVGHVDVTIWRKRDVGGQVERVRTASG